MNNDDKKTGSKARFFTRDIANRGIRVPLFDPETEEDSGEWLYVLGADSDEHRRAMNISQRDLYILSKNKQLTEEEKTDRFEDIKRRQIAALVKDWSFDEECTPESVESFLKEAPQITDAIDRVTADRSFFIKAGSKDSEPTPEDSSN
jgi:hypothetical protein